MTYYQKRRQHFLQYAAAYRERKRDEINRKQRERYANDSEYRDYQRTYQQEYIKTYGRNKADRKGKKK
jgi:hypothetical protein